MFKKTVLKKLSSSVMNRFTHYARRKKNACHRRNFLIESVLQKKKKKRFLFVPTGPTPTTGASPLPNSKTTSTPGETTARPNFPFRRGKILGSTRAGCTMSITMLSTRYKTCQVRSYIDILLLGNNQGVCASTLLFFKQDLFSAI